MSHTGVNAGKTRFKASMARFICFCAEDGYVPPRDTFSVYSLRFCCCSSANSLWDQAIYEGEGEWRCRNKLLQMHVCTVMAGMESALVS